MNRIPTQNFATWRLIAWILRTAYRTARLPYRAVVHLWVRSETEPWLPFMVVVIALMFVNFPW